MPKMKDSGIEWIGKIPENWKRDRIKPYFVFISGSGFKDSLQGSEKGEYPVCKASDISQAGRALTKAANYINKQQVISEGFKIIPSGSILFPKIGEAMKKNNRTLTTVDCCADNNCQGLVPHRIDSVYTYYLFKCIDMSWFDNGGTIPCLNNNRLKNCGIPIPPILEQKKIGHFLDSKCSEIDALSADIQKEIETLEEYKKSVIFDTVCHGISGTDGLIETSSDVWKQIPADWELVDIKYLFEIVKRIAGKEGYDVLSVTQKGLKIKDITSGDGQLADNYRGYQFVYPTDYVMNHMDLLTGWVDLSSVFGVTSPDYRVFRLIDKKNNCLEYYKYVMQCCYMNKIFYSLGQGVSNLGRWRLQTSSFNNFKIPVPPTDEQYAIADYLDNVVTETDYIIEEKKEQLTTLEEYKKSIIYEYVTGKKEVPEL